MAGKRRKPGARKKTPTPDQRRAREEMRTLSAAWNDLTEEQRQAWNGESPAPIAEAASRPGLVGVAGEGRFSKPTRTGWP